MKPGDDGLYKTEKIKPLGGLPAGRRPDSGVYLPLLVLFESVELRHAPFYLWIKDLAAPDPGTCTHADDGLR